MEDTCWERQMHERIKVIRLLQVCLGFIQNLDDDGVAHPVTNEYVLTGHYEIDIAGIRYLL